MLKGKTALITGSNSGIGLGVAQEMARAGADVIINSFSDSAADHAIAADIAAEFGVSARYIAADMSDEAACRALIKKAGQVDILVNNAGFGILGNHTEMQSERQLQMIDLNIHALTKLTHEFSNRMVKKGSGKIMNVASIAAYISGPGFAVYCATKAYVLSYSRALHKELKKRGVTVTALCPGYVVTGFQEVAGMKLSRMEKLSAVPVNKVANIAIKSMRKGRREVMPGIVNKPLPLVTRITPMWLQLIIVKQILN